MNVRSDDLRRWTQQTNHSNPETLQCNCDGFCYLTNIPRTVHRNDRRLFPVRRFFLHGEKFPRPPAIGTVYLVFDVLIEFAHVFMPLSHIKRPGTAQFNGVRSYNFEVYDERIKPRNLTKDLYVKEPLINQQFLQFISMYKQHIQIKKIKVQENFSVLLPNGTNFEIWIIIREMST